jgi:hypothetical protein
MTVGSGRHGGNGGTADVSVGVLDEHSAAEAEVGDMEAAPNGGRWWLATGWCSGSAGAAMRVHG